MPNDKKIFLSEIVNIRSGDRIPKLCDNGSYCVYGASKIMGYANTYNSSDDVLLIGRVGTLGIVQKEYNKCWISDNVLIIKSKYYHLVYQILKNIDYNSINKGSSQPLITQTDIKNLKTYIPNIYNINIYENNAEILNIKQKQIKLIQNKLHKLKNLYLKKFFN